MALKNSYEPSVLAACAAITSALALSFSIETAGLIAFIAPLLLGLALTGTSQKQNLISSAIYGIGAWILSSWWLGTGINAMNQTYWWAGSLGVITLAILNAVPYFTFAAISNACKLFEKKRSRPFLASALLTLLVELWPAHFPGSLSNAITSATRLIQICDWGGTPLIHFLIYSVGFSLTTLFRKEAGISIKFTAPLISFCLLICSTFYGTTRLADWRNRMTAITPVRISLVQPNLHIQGAVQNFGKAGTLDSLLTQTKQLLESSPTPELIVWPEIPIYFSPFNSPPDRARLDTLLAGQTTPLLLNADMFSNETINGRVPFYNAEQLFRGSGTVVEEYRKMMLVPLGEYLPYENLLSGPQFERILAGLRRYVAGKEVTLFHLSPGVTLGTPVCLEALHSAHIATMIEQGANILINPANDAYFGDTAGARLNFSFTILRAAEFRVPVVRVTNSGISAVINQLGEIMPESRMPQFSVATKTISVHPSSATVTPLTPRNRGIGILAILAIFCLTLSCVQANSTNYKHNIL